MIATELCYLTLFFKLIKTTEDQQLVYTISSQCLNCTVQTYIQYVQS